MMKKSLSRRTFGAISAATALGLGTATTRRVLGANERIRLGFIGTANRGMQLVAAFQKHAQCEVAGLCDVDQQSLAAADERLGGGKFTCVDFRDMLARGDIDAVVISTPDHWHAIQTIDACRAGKDVYVEKPLSITVHEGRRMVEVAREEDRVVQVGIQRRSCPLYAKAIELVRSGDLGKITVSRSFRLSNMAPEGIGRAAPGEPPEYLDWDLWLGPRPEQPFQATIAPYKFRWWHLYSSQMANWGVHSFDAIRMLTGDVAPASLCAIGGRYAVPDDRTIPDTVHALFEFDSGHLLSYGVYEANGNPAMARPAFVELRGTEGTLFMGDRSYEVMPERGGQYQDRQPRTEELRVEAEDWIDPTIPHAGNFLDCMRTRQRPTCDVEEGHRSTAMALLANISLEVRARVDWDSRQERIVSPEAANDLLHYEYRAPWKLG